jgi:hypothetical protein
MGMTVAIVRQCLKATHSANKRQSRLDAHRAETLKRLEEEQRSFRLRSACQAKDRAEFEQLWRSGAATAAGLNEGRRLTQQIVGVCHRGLDAGDAAGSRASSAAGANGLVLLGSWQFWWICPSSAQLHPRVGVYCLLAILTVLLFIARSGISRRTGERLLLAARLITGSAAIPPRLSTRRTSPSRRCEGLTHTGRPTRFAIGGSWVLTWATWSAVHEG